MQSRLTCHQGDADLTKLCDSQRLSLRDPKIEEKLFPHLYPYGMIVPSKDVTQSCVRNVTHGQYVKIRLMHADPRWRDDKLWPFFAYDWVMKHRILSYNALCPRIAVENENRDTCLTKEYILSELGDGEKVHHRLGQYVPPNLPGNKNYWQTVQPSRYHQDITASVPNPA